MYPILISLALLAADAPPPEREQALRATVAKFADAFVESKLRKAYAMVDDDSQEAFLDMGKTKFTAYEWKEADWSENFTRARVTLTVDTEFRFAQATVPVKRPWQSLWKWKDGEWLWSYEAPKRVETPFGMVTVNPGAPAKPLDVGKELEKAPKAEDLERVEILTPEISFSRSKASEAEIVLKNGLPGHVKLEPQIRRTAGLRIDKLDTSAGPGETVRFRLVWDPSEDAQPPESLSCAMIASPVGGTIPFTIFFRD